MLKSLLTLLVLLVSSTYSKSFDNNYSESPNQLSLHDITEDEAILLAERAHVMFKPKFRKNPVSENCLDYDEIEVKKFSTKQREVKNSKTTSSVVDRVVYHLTVEGKPELGGLQENRKKKIFSTKIFFFENFFQNSPSPTRRHGLQSQQQKNHQKRLTTRKLDYQVQVQRPIF